MKIVSIIHRGSNADDHLDSWLEPLFPLEKKERKMQPQRVSEQSERVYCTSIIALLLVLDSSKKTQSRTIQMFKYLCNSFHRDARRWCILCGYKLSK